MRSLRIVLPYQAELTLDSRHVLLFLAAISAACLLSTYVSLLHDSVARGLQWRADQQASTRPATPVPLALKPLVKQALADTGR